MSLVIEKIDLYYCSVAKEMAKILYVKLARSLSVQVFSATEFKALSRRRDKKKL